MDHRVPFVGFFAVGGLQFYRYHGVQILIGQYGILSHEALVFDVFWPGYVILMS